MPGRFARQAGLVGWLILVSGGADPRAAKMWERAGITGAALKGAARSAELS